MRAALGGLTTRGRSFLAAGVAAVLAAVALGERDLLRVAVLLALLPLLGAWYVGRGRHHLRTRRELSPPRVAAGTPVRVRLHLRNAARLPVGTLLLAEGLPGALGAAPRLVLERLGPQASTDVAYTLEPARRGRYPIGPLRARVTDPFGLCRLDHTCAERESLTVVPRTEPLPAGPLRGAHAGAGEARGRAVSVHGEDDTGTREYRHGDDLRRVHWRSTARAGELMVRREEQPWENRALVLLDNRAPAHHDADGPADTFEWAVGAAASVAAHLRRGGHRVRLVCAAADRDGLRHPALDHLVHDAASEQAALDRLADVDLRHGEDLAPLVAQARRVSDQGLTVAVLGGCDTAAARRLAALGGPRGQAVALVADPRDWGPGAAAVWGAGAALLRAAGWRVAAYRPDRSVAQVWAELAAVPGPTAVGGAR
ncbi:membrane protein [Pilimelia terevasa]|uniref:Membrane protein n=1 Tax=Pilimelia terevasa TaxID=53372 RepID=A0A8J3BJI6_9ACTN|nr:DUF58 domain-containing protein [Pilimelia terevasa]GGK26113.1 membrane protein [Pilimelia terevasa]